MVADDGEERYTAILSPEEASKISGALIAAILASGLSEIVQGRP